jgi:hypothetical protein
MSKGVGRGVVPIGRLARFVRGVLWRRSWGDGARRYLRLPVDTRIEILVRFDGDGGAPQRARASIGPYRVAGARTPRALHRSMAADGLIPRHGRGRRGACSGRVATVARASAAAITAFGRRRRAGLMGTACAERAGTATSSRRDSSWRCATWAAVGRRAAIEAGEAKRGGRWVAI